MKIGTGVFGVPLAQRCGLSGCSDMVIWSLFITSRLCCGTLRSFRHVLWGRFEHWHFLTRCPRCSRRGLWSGSVGLIQAFTVAFFWWRRRQGDGIRSSTYRPSMVLWLWPSSRWSQWCGFWGRSGSWLDVLHRPQRLLPGPHPSGLLSVSTVCSWGSGLPVAGSVLWSAHSS